MKDITHKQLFHVSTNGYAAAIALITACFVLWGFANNITNPMVNSFSKIFRISTTEASLVPVAFNLGYFCMAFPAAILIQRYSYKWGVMVGLGLYALGALLFIPARWIGEFYPFLGFYFVMTCGLSFLETSCNPYIYSLGSEKTAIQRLNGAQAFNALGCIVGMLLAMTVQSKISPMDSRMRMELPQAQFDVIKDYDLGVLIQPYIYIGALVILVLVLIALSKMPQDTDIHTEKKAGRILKELWQFSNYREGVIALFFYIGAQVTCWSFIINYGMRVFVAEGMSEQAAEVLAQKYNVIAMVLFAISRFVCTWLMNWFAPSRILSTLGIIGIVALIGTILFTDRNGIYCLVAVSGCLSLMFPTIYGIALTGVGENIKIAGAGLIMAILGGSFFPPIQAAIIQSNMVVAGLPCTNVSFVIPLICMGVVVWYAHRSYVRRHIHLYGTDTPFKFIDETPS
ncbi:MAG: L-fucose:H+ symporter permease [Prevotella sp.]|nr:L-fucose:H+ symporter permease [Prevotella sp.]